MVLARSKFTIGFLVAFLAGIFFGSFFNFDIFILGGLGLGLTLCLLAFYKTRILFFTLIVASGLIFGLFYINYYKVTENKKNLPYDQKQSFAIKILGLPQEKGELSQYLCEFNNQNFTTKVLLLAPKYPTFSYGDVLEVTGEISDPSGQGGQDGFDYGRYLKRQGIRGVVKNFDKIEKVGERKNFFTALLYLVAQKAAEILNKILSEPFASLQNGLLLGAKNAQLPSSLDLTFKRAGLTHIIAVSGYNVTIVIAAVFSLFLIFGRRAALIVAFLAVLGFVILTGASPSVVRAGILGSLVIVGKWQGRRINYLILILFTAALMLMFEPFALVNSASFQLSFLAFCGLIYLSPAIAKILNIKYLSLNLRQIISETVAAQLAVLPLLIYSFGAVSIIAPLANVLVLPFIPLAMGFGFLALLGAIIFLPLGEILALVPYFLLKYIIEISEFFARMPFALYELKTSTWWWIPFYYLALIYFVKKSFSIYKGNDEEKFS